MLPSTLFAILVGAMAVWFISISAISLLSLFVGPLAYLLVGLVLLAVAKYYFDKGQPPDDRLA